MTSMTIIKGQRYWHTSRSRECTVVSRPFRKVSAGGTSQLHQFVKVQDDTGYKWDALVARLEPMPKPASEHSVTWMLDEGFLLHEILCAHEPLPELCARDHLLDLTLSEFLEAFAGAPGPPLDGAITTAWTEGTRPDEPGLDPTITWNYLEPSSPS